jgi:ppGpp synthetase/RelA/SpoT-type nucleotidyltranferase
MSRVSDFVKRYVREQDYYAKVAELVGRRLERALRDESIRAITTWRAKRPDRLQSKLETREQVRKDAGRGPYISDDEIYDDIPDLAGARVALYFPSDRGRVRGLIESSFSALRKAKSFPLPHDELSEADRERRARKRFSGYAAEHFRVRLHDAELSADEKKYGDGRCEIQVASVLMHAWAEVEHDLEYKTLRGSVTATESALLDQINGLVIAGEMALEQLQQATVARGTGSEGSSDRPFRDQYDLANGLLAIATELMQRNVLASRPQVGRADLAFRFIQLLGGSPAQTLSDLRHRFLSAEQIDAEKPLAQLLIEMLLDDDPTREEILQRAKSEIAASDSASAPAAASTDAADVLALGQFLTHWRRLEETVRRLADRTKMGTAPFSKLVHELDGLDELDRAALLRLSRLRNQALHSTTNAPSAAVLLSASERAKRLEHLLNARFVLGPVDQHSAATAEKLLESGGLTVHRSAAFVSKGQQSALILIAVTNRAPVVRQISEFALLLGTLPIVPTKNVDVNSSEFPVLDAEDAVDVEPQATKRFALHFAVSATFLQGPFGAALKFKVTGMGEFAVPIEVRPMSTGPPDPSR